MIGRIDTRRRQPDNDQRSPGNPTRRSRPLPQGMLAVCVFLLAACADTSPAHRLSFASERAALVARIQRAAREDYPGLISDPHFRAALAVVRSLPRERFVPSGERSNSYRDTPLPIGYDQTISDAYIVTVMTAALALPQHARVLEIGTGSGYQAAVLSRLAASVDTIEIVPPLATRAASLLKELRITNVTVHQGDGFLGWPADAPYDAIIVTAGAAMVPPPLIAQLRPGGRLIMPVGPHWALEQLILFTKEADGRLTRCSMGPVMFVALTGRGERPPGAHGLFDHIPKCF